MLIIDTNNKAWLKYVGQQTGSTWTILNGAEVSVIPQIRLFHLDIFSICKVDFRFEFPLAIPDAQTVSQPIREEININSQSSVLEEIQVLPDPKETQYLEVEDNLDLNVDIQELEENKKRNTKSNHLNSGPSQNEEIQFSEKISHSYNQTVMIDTSVSNMNSDVEKETSTEMNTYTNQNNNKKKSTPKEDDSSNFMKVINTKKSLKEPDVLEVELLLDEAGDQVSKVEGVKTRKRKRKSLTTPSFFYKSKTWERYWTPSSEKRLRRPKKVRM